MGIIKDQGMPEGMVRSAGKEDDACADLGQALYEDIMDAVQKAKEGGCTFPHLMHAMAVALAQINHAATRGHKPAMIENFDMFREQIEEYSEIVAEQQKGEDSE